MKKITHILIIIFMTALLFNGCESMGRAAAKTEKGIQKGADKLEDTIENATDQFNDGYEEEKNKQ